MSLRGRGVTVTLGESRLGVGMEPDGWDSGQQLQGGLHGERSALLREVGAFSRSTARATGTCPLRGAEPYKSCQKERDLRVGSRPPPPPSLLV